MLLNQQNIITYCSNITLRERVKTTKAQQLGKVKYNKKCNINNPANITYKKLKKITILENILRILELIF